MNQEPKRTESGREIRSASRVPDVSNDDLKIAIELDKEGKQIPDSLKPALEAHKAEHGGSPIKKVDEKPEEDAVPLPKVDAPKDPPEDPKKPVAGGKDDDGGESGDDTKGEDGRAEDESNVELKNPSKRPVRAMPISKFNAKNEAWKEQKAELLGELDVAKAKIAEFEKASKAGDENKMEEILKTAAEKSGIDEDTLKTIFSVMEDGAIKPLQAKIADLESAIKTANVAKAPTADDAEKAKWKEQDDKFEEEFVSTLKGADTDPEMAKHKDEIKELAFMEGYESKSVWEIYTRFVKPKANKKAPAENPNGNGGGTKSDTDWDAIATDPEKIRALSLSDAEKFQNYMASKPRPIRRIR